MPRNRCRSRKYIRCPRGCAAAPAGGKATRCGFDAAYRPRRNPEPARPDPPRVRILTACPVPTKDSGLPAAPMKENHPHFSAGSLYAPRTRRNGPRITRAIFPRERGTLPAKRRQKARQRVLRHRLADRRRLLRLSLQESGHRRRRKALRQLAFPANLNVFLGGVGRLTAGVFFRSRSASVFCGRLDTSAERPYIKREPRPLRVTGTGAGTARFAPPCTATDSRPLFDPVSAAN
jgi:hypothetical protein